MKINTENYSTIFPQLLKNAIENLTVPLSLTSIENKIISKEHIKKRLYQLILQFSYNEILSSSTDFYQENNDLSYFKKPFIGTLLKIDWEKSTIKITKTLKLKILKSFLIKSLLNTSGLVIGFICTLFKKEQYKDICLILENIFGETTFGDKRQKEVYKFLRYGKIKPLNNSMIFSLGIGKQKGCIPDNLCISRFPLLKSLQYKKYPFIIVVKYLFKNIINFLSLPSLIFSNNANLLFINDQLDIYFIDALAKEKYFSNVFITNSNIIYHPLFFSLKNRIHTNMIWYSTNWRIMNYVKKTQEDYNGCLSYAYISISTHWVWNEKQGQSITELCQNCSYTICGSILFYLNDHRKNNVNTIFSIGCFDVTPIKSEAWKSAYGYAKNYITPEVNKMFWLDIIEVSKEVIKTNYEINFKQKRKFHIWGSIEYKNHIDELENKSLIKRIDVDINLYEYISKLNLVICLPCTSPALIAKEFGIPAIFYDPTMEIFIDEENLAGINFIAGKKSLKNYFIERFN